MQLSLTLVDVISIITILIGVGIWLGVKLANSKWKRNAECIQRIESGGRLFKVLDARLWDHLKHEAGWEPSNRHALH